MSKHLLDETAEFKLPTLGRHAADDDLETTQGFDPGFRQRRLPTPSPQPTSD